MPDSEQRAAWRQFMHLTGEIQGAYHDVAVKMGLSDSIMRILYTVCVMEGKCYLSEIGRLAGLSKQTINSAIRALEEKEWIALEDGRGRNRYVCLTDTGKAACRQRVFPLIALENRIWIHWPENERQELFRLTEKYLVSFQQLTENLPPSE